MIGDDLVICTSDAKVISFRGVRLIPGFAIVCLDGFQSGVSGVVWWLAFACLCDFECIDLSEFGLPGFGPQLGSLFQALVEDCPVSAGVFLSAL